MTTQDNDKDWRAFIAPFKSVFLSTIDVKGNPHASMTPFVTVGRHLYILVSSLAEHVRNLEQHGHASLLWATPDGESVQPFARERVTFYCRASRLLRESQESQDALSAMEQRFGPVIDTLVSLPDFAVFRLEPQHGRWIRGFGQAYDIDGPELNRLTHVSPPDNQGKPDS